MSVVLYRLVKTGWTWPQATRRTESSDPTDVSVFHMYVYHVKSPCKKEASASIPAEIQVMQVQNFLTLQSSILLGPRTTRHHMSYILLLGWLEIWLAVSNQFKLSYLTDELLYVSRCEFKRCNVWSKQLEQLKMETVSRHMVENRDTTFAGFNHIAA